MNKIEDNITLPFLDHSSQVARETAKMNAEMALKELQKKDSRFNDPMMAYKFLKEREQAELIS